ncbi:MAG: hypothetical protein BroJett021_28060 [Chloroflexota bacterium]|nr:MAG: hypothetical protein BroJett021_28060 [Chloroflexota bacterium]
MTQLAVTLPPLHEHQRIIAEHPARFRVLACGRRWGKTRLGALLSCVAALRRGRAWWVAPSYKMAAVGWRLVQQLGRQIPGAALRQTDKLLSMPGGGTVQVRSADDPQSLRGEGLDFLVMDECAFIPEAAWTEALRPALADRQGRALFISTPKGRNWFWRLWQMGQPPNAQWASWRFATATNPFIQPEEIEAARGSLPERVFRQEFLAEFIDDAGGVFRRVAEMATAAPEDVGTPGDEYVIGVDWGKHNDFTALAVLNTGRRALVHLDRFNQIDYAVQLKRLRALYERFRPVAIIAERNSIGEPLIEQLQREGLPVQPFMTTNASKTVAIEALALAFERGDVRIVADPVLVNELQAYEMERLPSGLMRYSAPEGLHDDTVMALALAWQGIGREAAIGPNIWG